MKARAAAEGNAATELLVTKYHIDERQQQRSHTGMHSKMHSRPICAIAFKTLPSSSPQPSRQDAAMNLYLRYG